MTTFRFDRPFGLACCLALLLNGIASDDLMAQSDDGVDSVLERVVEGGDPMPRFIPSSYSDRSPLFIAAEKMFSEDGSIDPSWFRPVDLKVIQQQLAQAPTDGCIRLDMDNSVHFSPDGMTWPISKAMMGSKNAVVAEVTGLIYGYQEFSAGTLLRVETREVLHGEVFRETYLIFFPVGSFEVAGYRICFATSGFPSPPHLGDRVLLLHPDISLAADREFLHILAMNVVVLPRDGVVRYSKFHGPAFEKSELMEPSEFLESVRALFLEDRF